MLRCGHDWRPYGSPLCIHMGKYQDDDLSYYRWYTGNGLDSELLCTACMNARENGQHIATACVCESCFDYTTSEAGSYEGYRGQPEIRLRPEPIHTHLQATPLPAEIGTLVDLAPVERAERSLWIVLTEVGSFWRFDAHTGVLERLARATLEPEPDHAPWCGHALKRRLHVSQDGTFAAVVHDYGHRGHIVDLRTGQVTLTLDGGDYHSETVPFSFAFAALDGRVLAIHRTAWNRLDVSDPATGELLSAREMAKVSSGDSRPTHDLDYFHGALLVSPNNVRIADDGWVWSPVGIPTVWSLEPWLSGRNVWESEDGPTLKNVCVRSYYWDHAMVWLDDQQLAISGIGDDDDGMLAGVRLFDVSSTDKPREVGAIFGPAGHLFWDGRRLYSSNEHGLARWDVADSSRTGLITGFCPTHQHRGARELVQVVDGHLVRWSTDAVEA